MSHIGNPTLASGPPPLMFSSADIRQAVESVSRVHHNKD
jgi:hypothetical protein